MRNHNHREYLEQLKKEGHFDGENYKVNTTGTLAMMSLVAEACDLLEEIRDEIKLRKDDGR